MEEKIKHTLHQFKFVFGQFPEKNSPDEQRPSMTKKISSITCLLTDFIVLVFFTKFKKKSSMFIFFQR